MGEKIISKKFLAVLIVFILVTILAAQYNHFSDRFDFVDQVMHFLGGVWVGVLFFVFFQEHAQFFDLAKNRWLTAFFALAATAFIGVGWEFFEYVIGVLTKDLWIGSAAWGLDTLSDLFLDLVGAAVAAAYALLSRRK